MVPRPSVPVLAAAVMVGLALTLQPQGDALSLAQASVVVGLGLWLLGVSLLDVAPYMYDALQPQLTLLNGSVGEAGGHDWIVLVESIGLLAQAQTIGLVVHRLGALVLLLALGWGAWLLVLQRRRIGGAVLREG